MSIIQKHRIKVAAFLNFPDVTHLTLEAPINQESIENLKNLDTLIMWRKLGFLSDDAFSKLSNQAKAN